jgi:hypothetical protein
VANHRQRSVWAHDAAQLALEKLEALHREL